MRLPASTIAPIRRTFLACIVLIALASGAQAQDPVGSQFQINTYTTDIQVRPSLSLFPDGAAAGGFVVTWESGPLGYPAYETIFARRFASDGAPLSGELQVNTVTGTQQRYSVAAATPGGGFVVVWHSSGSAGSDGDGTSIQGRRYASDGTPDGDQFQINSNSVGSQRTPAVAVAPSGEFVVAWTSPNLTVAQRFDSAGDPVGAELSVNELIVPQRVPSVEYTPDGGFLIVWEAFGSNGTDTSERSVQGRRFDSGGSAVSGEFQINTYTTGIQGAPDVAVRDDGSFVVVWHGDGSFEDDSSFFSVQGQRFAADATTIGSQFQLNTLTTFSQSSPSIEHAGDDFFVTWQNTDNPDIFNFINSVRARRFAMSGTPLGDQFQIPTYTTGSEYFPEVATDGAGRFVVVWTGTASPETDTSMASIHGQRFSLGLFIDGFENGNTDAWSAAVP